MSSSLINSYSAPLPTFNLEKMQHHTPRVIIPIHLGTFSGQSTRSWFGETVTSIFATAAAGYIASDAKSKRGRYWHLALSDI